MSFGQGSSVRSNPLRHESVTARRQVFKTDEIPHKWAHQTQEAARNAQGNLYFKGPTIYSYRDSWPLARIYEKRKGAMSRCSVGHGGGLLNATVRDAMWESGVLVLTNSERASVTSSGHQHAVNRAVSHLPSIAVPHVEAHYYVGRPVEKHDHDVNLKYLTDMAADYLKKAQRSLSTAQTRRRYDAAARMIEDAAVYMTFFGIRRKAPVFPQAEWDAAIVRATRIEHPDPASADKRERDRAQRKERLRERDEYLAEQRRSIHAAKQKRDFYRIGAAQTSWRLGDVWGCDYEALRSSACLLRVDDSEIETSWGARIPLAQAPRLWYLVETCRKAGGHEFSGHVKAGDYSLTRIEADGKLVVGCHAIPYSELRATARQLGLIVRS